MNHDWSDIEEILQSESSRNRGRSWAARNSNDDILPGDDDEPGTQINNAPVMAPLQDTRVLALKEEANGLVARYKANAIRRDAALAGLRKVVDGQLEVLNHFVETAVLVKKSKLDVDVKEFLAQLDSEHLRILDQFDVKNMQQRARTLFDLNDRYCDLVREASSKSWPPTLLSETLRNVTELRGRIVTQINEDFPSRHQRRN